MGVSFVQETIPDSILQEVQVVSQPTSSLDAFKIKGSTRLQSFDCLNCNRRIYSRAVGQKILEEANDKINDSSTFFGGELDHPLVEQLSNSAALKRQMCVLYEKVSHKFNRVWMEGDILCGECETLSTPNGKTMAGLAAIDRIPIAFSARALGKTKPAPRYGTGAVEVCNPICIAAYDCVQSPSHRGSVMTEVTDIIRSSKNIGGKLSENDSNIVSESYSDISVYRDLFLSEDNAIDHLINAMIYNDDKLMDPLQERKYVRASMDNLLEEYLITTPDTVNGKSRIDVLNESNVQDMMKDYSYRRSEYNRISDIGNALKRFLNM